MWIWIKNTAFSMQIRGFAICRLDTKEICGLIITNLQICDLRTCTPKKFADLRWCGMSPRMFGFAAQQKNLRAHLLLKRTVFTLKIKNNSRHDQKRKIR
jgi:hypothetical protein